MDDKTMLELAARAAGLMSYCKDTGTFTWLPRDASEKDAARWNSRYAGKEAGTVDDKGYRRAIITFRGRKEKIRLHRLAWFVCTGQMPAGEIDHINQNKLDNRISNLRDVPKSVNQRNSRINSNNTSGAIGVTWHKQRGKWCAQASVDGKHHHIGLFENKADAEEAAKSFRRKNGFTELHGRAAAEIGKGMGVQDGNA